MTTNKLNIFTAEDFAENEHPFRFDYRAADIANAIFNQWLEKQVVVYGTTEHTFDGITTKYPIFRGAKRPHDTHKALLVNITKIEGGKE